MGEATPDEDKYYPPSLWITLTVRGVSGPLWLWAETAGLIPSTLRTRIANGWDHESAVAEPAKHCGRGGGRPRKNVA